MSLEKELEGLVEKTDETPQFSEFVDSSEIAEFPLETEESSEFVEEPYAEFSDYGFEESSEWE